jgi:hypothetical protein
MDCVSTVVEHLCRHPKVEGLRTAEAGTWGKMMKKNYSSISSINCVNLRASLFCHGL